MSASTTGAPHDAPSATFRSRLAAGEQLTGVVVRTPSHHTIEVFASAPGDRRVDVVMIDTEHAPIDAGLLDVMLAVATARELPALVRIGELSRPLIQQALDGGATGIVVPHVDSVEAARAAVRLAHYGDGGRGFSGSTRAGGWGRRPMQAVIEHAAATTTVVVQVEDPAALDVIDEIVSVDGIDAVFIGPADLAVAMGATSLTDSEVTGACASVVRACSLRQVPIVAFAGDPTTEAMWRQRGAALVLAGTDQSPLAR